MAGYFGTGERFKHNPEPIPGPGEYDPRTPEGFKVDPKSGFLGNGRFEDLAKEGPVPAPDISPPRPRFKPTPGTEGRKFSWATQRISELEKDLERSKKLVKELRAQQDKDKKEFDILLSQQHGLIQQAENEEGTLKASLVAAEEALKDSKNRLRSAEEAQAAALTELVSVRRDKEQLEGELAKQWQEMHAQVSIAQERRASAEEQCAGLKVTVSRLGRNEVETLEDAVKMVSASLHQLSALQHRCEENEGALVEKEADLQAKAAAERELDGRLQAALASIADLEDSLSARSAALEAKTSELNDVSLGLREDLRLARQSHQEEKSALDNALAETKTLLKSEAASFSRLEANLLAKTAECQQLTGAAEVLRLELTSLQQTHDSVSAEFQQHKQEAATQFQHLSAKLATDSQALAQITTSLAASKAETQRLEVLTAELQAEAESNNLAATQKQESLIQEKGALQEENEELRSQNLVLDRKVTGLSAESAAQAAELADLTGAKLALQQEISQLALSLDSTSSELATTSTENARLGQAVVGLQQQLADVSMEAEKVAEDLKEQLSVSSAANKDLATSKAKLELQLSGCTSELAAVTTAKATADDEIKDLSTQVRDLISSEAALQNSLAETNSSQDILSAEYASLNAAHAEVSLQHASLTARTARLESHAEDLEAELLAEKERAARLDTACASQKLELAQAAAAKAAADKDTELLQARYESLEESVDSLNSNLAESSAQKAALEASMSCLKQSLVESEAAREAASEQIVELKAAAKSLAAAREAAKAAGADLESRLEVALKHGKEADLTIEQQLRDLTGSRAAHASVVEDASTLKEELAATLASNKSLQAVLSKEEASKAAAEAAAAKLQEQLQAFQDQLVEACGANDSVRLALTDSEAAVADLKAAVAREQGKCTHLGQKAAKRSEQNKAAAELERSLRADLTKSNTENCALEKEVGAATAAKQALEVQLSALHVQVTELEEHKHALQVDNEQLSDANAGLEKATAGLKMDLDGEQNSNAALRATVSELQGRLVQTEADAKDLVAKLEVAEAQITAQKAEIQELKVSNHKYRTKRQQLQEHVDQLTVASPGFSESHTAELHSLQEEVLDMHENMRVLEARANQAEESLEQKTRQFAQLQEQLLDVEDEAAVCRASGSEAQRLTEENTLLASQLQQLEINLQDLMSTAGLGHNNSKQKIQFHLRLKQELEEMRHECMLLLRERFHLEQCVRYLAARSALSRRLAGDVGPAGGRSPLERNPVQPASLRKNMLYATPSRRQSMLRSSRSRATCEMSTAPSKEEIVASIEQTVSLTASSYRTLTDDLEHTAVNNKENAAAAATPRHRQLHGRPQSMDLEDPESPTSSTPSESDPAGRKGIESRIVAKIVEICSPNKTGRTSRLMMLDPHVDEERAQQTPTAASGRPLGNADNLSAARGSMTARSIWK